MAKIILTKQLLNDSIPWAKLWVEENPEHRIRISKADIISMFGSNKISDFDSIVENAYTSLLDAAMQRGLDIVIDDMHFDSVSINNIKKYIQEFNEWIKLSPLKVQYEMEYRGSSKDSFIENVDYDK